MPKEFRFQLTKPLYIEHFCTDPRCTYDKRCPTIREEREREVSRQINFKLSWRDRLRVLFTGSL